MAASLLAKPRRRWARRVILGSVILGGLWLVYPCILRFVGGLLVSNGPYLEYSHVVLVSGDRRFDVAARLHREVASRRFLLIEPYPDRLVQNDIVPSFESTCRYELNSRGVPDEAIELIPGGARDGWSAARRLRRWMTEHPEARLLLLCDRFKSRCQRPVLDAVLDPQDVARISVRGLPDRWYDETDWWRSRRGTREALLGLVSLGYLWCNGETQTHVEPWNPDDYEQMLWQTVRGGPS